ncbi:MAG: ribosome biogenesis GTPase Der [Kiloniellales bacterium]|nr:ribosome biogenesis GTPase Der [Kiloniellales bacterium]
MRPLTVAIIGRPNVGKSTLFNRLAGRKLALVHEAPGVTRDRREAEAQLHDLRLRVIDTAGLEEAAPEALESRMRRQTERALQSADLVLFLIDARAGLTALDRHFARWLRRQDLPVVLVANKCEGRAAEAGLAEAYGLGFGDPVPLSAEHDLGFSDLRDAVAPFAETAAETAAEEALPEDAETAEGEAGGPLQLAIVGRPNVGKSTLVNRLVGEDRVLTGPEAGITRDAIAVQWSYRGQEIQLVDTAGLRKRAKVAEKLERMSVDDTLRAIRFAQVVVLVLDANEGLERQDLTIARHSVDEGRALVIALNKWDACADREAALRQLEDRLERSLPQVRGLPKVAISALEGRHLDRLMDAVLAAYRVWNARVPTGELNRWLEAVTEAHPPPLSKGRKVRLKYATQMKTRPPSYAIFCSRPAAIPASYLRYLENQLRSDFKLDGTPIRIALRKGENPYAKTQGAKTQGAPRRGTKKREARKRV